MSQTSRKAAVLSPELEPVPPAFAAVRWVDLVQEKVESIEYGFVQIVVHDSKVVQIESTERHRFDLRRAGKDVESPLPAGKLRTLVASADRETARKAGEIS